MAVVASWRWALLAVLACQHCGVATIGPDSLLGPITVEALLADMVTNALEENCPRMAQTGFGSEVNATLTREEQLSAILEAVRTLKSRQVDAIGTLTEARGLQTGLVQINQLVDAVKALRDGQRQLEAQLAAAGSCPRGWSRWLNACYLVPPTVGGWHEAVHLCDMLHGAQLASIHLASSEFLADMVAGSGRRQVWVGLERRGSVWSWRDGTALDYTNWRKGEPNMLEDKEKYAFVYGAGVPDREEDTWNDSVCVESNHFLCQLNLV